MRILTALVAVLMLGVVRVVPAAAQIDPVSAVNGSLSAAQQAGVAITALVVLGGGLLISGGGVLLWYRDRQATRASQREERKLTREALTESSAVNKMLLARLDTLTDTLQSIAGEMKLLATNIGTQTTAVDSLIEVAEKLMDAINETENTRAERYAALMGRQDNVEKAAEHVAEELRGVKRSVDDLAEKVAAAQTLSESDRAEIRTLTGKVDTLLQRLEGDGHETGDDGSGTAGADGGAGGGASDTGAGGNAGAK